MRIPVVLPVVCVHISEDGTLRVDVDGESYETDHQLTRSDLGPVLDQITSDRGCAVRVEVTEADGTTYADIATPPARQPVLKPPIATTVGAPGLIGHGFQPGEEIAIAYVVARQRADDQGATQLRLPPALLAAKRDGLVLLGLSSRVIAALE